MKKYEILQEVALIDHILSELPHEIRFKANLSQDGYDYIVYTLEEKRSALIALSKIR